MQFDVIAIDEISQVNDRNMKHIIQVNNKWYQIKTIMSILQIIATNTSL